MSPGRVFERLVATLDYPMVVATVAGNGRRDGCLVGFTTQVSIHPPRYLVCLSVRNHTYRTAVDAPAMAVHFLERGDEELARLFGGTCGAATDKFAAVAWEDGPAGVPVLGDCARWFAGPIVERIAFGDHVGFVVEPVAARTPGRETAQLGFADVRDIDPGHDP